MQKEYSVKEIKEMCGNARLTITNITSQTVTAINTRNGMQHIFKIKQLNAQEELNKHKPQILLQEIKEDSVPITKEDIREEKIMQQMAKEEKERIKQSFEALHSNKSKEDDYVLPDLTNFGSSDPTGMDAEINDFAKDEGTSIVSKQEYVVDNKPEKKPYTGKPRGRKPGTKIDKKTGKLVMAKDLKEE